MADRDPYEQPVPDLAAGRRRRRGTSGAPFPFGLDARGRTVSVPLVWSSLLIGSIPRMGKTNAARIPAAAAALDPHTPAAHLRRQGRQGLRSPSTQVAHFYASGVRQPVVEALVEVLADAVEDMNARYERMADLPDDICPEGKVTPQITRRAGYGMPLTVIFVDEVHRYLEHPEHGKTICGLLTELAKAGPAAGYMLVLATQRPDTKTVPEDLRGQIGTRFALRTMNWQASETILGAGTYTAGLDSSKFLRTHLGVGILLGNDDNQATDGEAVTVRTHLLDLAALRRLCRPGPPAPHRGRHPHRHGRRRDRDRRDAPAAAARRRPRRVRARRGPGLVRDPLRPPRRPVARRLRRLGPHHAGQRLACLRRRHRPGLGPHPQRARAPTAAASPARPCSTPSPPGNAARGPPTGRDRRRRAPQRAGRL